MKIATSTALLLFCYLASVSADLRVTEGGTFRYDTPSNLSIDFPEPNPSKIYSAVYSISFNVTGNWTYIRVNDVAIDFSKDLEYKSEDQLDFSNNGGNFPTSRSISQDFDPCRYPIPANETVPLRFNATTDSTSGRIYTSVALVDVLPVTNGAPITVTCPFGFACIRYLYFDIDPPASTYFLNFTGTLTKGNEPTLTLAGGMDTCPTQWSNMGVRVEQKITNGVPLMVNTTVSYNATRYWIKYFVNNPTSDSSTLNFSWAASLLPKTPVSEPSSKPAEEDFPNWAIALCVVGGVLIAGVVIFVIVKASRKRTNYTAV